MSSSPIAPDQRAGDSAPDAAWSWKKRWLVIAIVFVTHIGLIFAFGDRKGPKSQPLAPVLTTTFLFDSSKLPPMANPILFALPHHKSFGGSALVKIPTISFPPFRWTEPPRFLSLSVEGLDAAFDHFSEASSIASYQFEFKPPARLAIPFVPEIRMDTRSNSTIRLSDELSKRRLLGSPDLPSQPPMADLLTNTVVRVVVGADGLVASAIQLRQPPGSGSEKADREALAYARAMRFAPLPLGAKEPSVGSVIFLWHIAPTNSLPGARK